MVVELKLTDRGDERRRSGALWLYSSDVDPPGATCPNGSVVDLVSPEGHFRGRGFYSSESNRTVQVISNSKTGIDATFYRKRIRRAIEFREGFCSDRMSYRVVHGDGDYLPGLVVDRYGEYLVVQFRHPTIEDHKSTLVDVLDEELEPRSIYCRNDFEARSSLGLDCYSELLRGEEVPDTVRVQRAPFEMVADLKNGQKTGFYLDQAWNRRAFTRYLTGGSGLDCFCYSGGWGLEALAADAEFLTFVDGSEDALELVRENLRLNGWEDRSEVVEADAFDYLNERTDEDAPFDFIALDPPAFATREAQKEGALRGYKEVNLRAMRLLKGNGLLATSSCSSPVDREDFLGVLRSSTEDAHVNSRILEDRFQGPDHPWRPRLPKTQYLNAVICEISLN